MVNFNQKTIGIIMLVAAALILLSYTSIGSAIDLPSPLPAPDGKQVQCTANIDKDSIHSASCNVASTCRTSTFGFFGFLDAKTKLSLYAGGDKVRSIDVDTSVLGTNKDVSIAACVPNTASGGLLVLTDDQNVQQASLQVGW